VRHDPGALATEYERLAVERSQALTDNDSKRANRCYDRMHRVKNRMRALPDRGAGALKRVLSSNEDPNVRLMVAAALLAVDEVLALAELDDLASRCSGLVSASARMTADEWKRGALRDYWD